ncbi:hypothetical protein DFH08DRAFT_921849 [Mycena albidolilacea]|uniref:Uncharacterized protein n=1 Tax=Mycena albidolilacea TaxID=1033008 RepID=A0AAD7AGI1_9AGAR|nr:hypothetical protein DFH08DRAFT_921849 [Mycena albidolilacea]
MSEEKYLTLADGRTLAYEDVGDPSSSLVVIFLHRVFELCRYPHMELITLLHPDTADLHIYISGGLYGSIPHTSYTKSMTWSNYMLVGLPARILPFQPLLRVGIFALSMKISTMDKAEREQWGIKGGDFEMRMATNMVKSISKLWAGFIEIADVVHSDWGFRPDQLDEDHTRGRPILIAASAQDDLGSDMANWLKENYKNSRLKWVHLSTLYEIDNLWAELLAMKDETTY